jgi:hypothetical protein
MRAHTWTVVAEFDAGYVIGRCEVCGQQDLLDVGALLPAPRAEEDTEAGAAQLSRPVTAS